MKEVWYAYESVCGFVLFFNDTATTESYTLSLHDALPISRTGQYNGGALPQREMGSIKSGALPQRGMGSIKSGGAAATKTGQYKKRGRSEEHTSELQSLTNLVCRLLLEKKKHNQTKT